MGQAVKKAALACLLLAQTACVSVAHERAPTQRVRPSVLSLIEGQASDCIWADASQLSASERVLFATLVPTDAIAFEPQVLEYARCIVQTDDGVVETTAVRLSASHEAPRFASPEAHWASADTLLWSTAAPHGAPLGEDVRRSALRVLASEVRPFLLLATSPTGTSLTLRTTYTREARGVRIATDHTGGMPDVPEADVPFAVDMLLTMLAQATQSFSARMQAQSLGHAAHFSWSMLQLEANDAALATPHSRARTRLPLSAFDPARLDLIRAEALQRCADARRAQGGEHAARARDCALFYSYLYTREERVIDAQQAVTAYRDAGLIEDAYALAERAYLDTPSDPRTHAMWIETASPSRLAEVFARVHPEVAPEARARFVEAAPRYLSEGLTGLVLEASFLASLTPAPRAQHPMPRVELPAEALADLAYVLLLAEGAGGSFSVRVEGDLHAEAPEVTLGIGARWNAESNVWAASVSEPSLARIRPLSHALRVQLAASGRVRLSASLGAQRLAWTLVSEAGHVSIEADATRRDWMSLARDVAHPLAQLPATRFPLPSLSLTLPTETLAALSPTLASTSGIQCTTTPTSLTCAAREAGPDVLLGVLVELARILAR